MCRRILTINQILYVHQYGLVVIPLQSKLEMKLNGRQVKRIDHNLLYTVMVFFSSPDS